MAYTSVFMRGLDPVDERLFARLRQTTIAVV